MPTIITMTGERSDTVSVTESVEDVMRLIREAGTHPPDKLVVLTHVDGGKVAVIAADITRMIERV